MIYTKEKLAAEAKIAGVPVELYTAWLKFNDFLLKALRKSFPKIEQIGHSLIPCQSITIEIGMVNSSYLEMEVISYAHQDEQGRTLARVRIPHHRSEVFPNIQTKALEIVSRLISIDMFDRMSKNVKE